MLTGNPDHLEATQYRSLSDTSYHQHMGDPKDKDAAMEKNVACTYEGLGLTRSMRYRTSWVSVA